MSCARKVNRRGMSKRVGHDHLAAMARVAELEAQLAKTNPRSNDLAFVPAEHAALQMEIDDLRSELFHLKQLGLNDAGLHADITASRREVQDAWAEVERLRTQRSLDMPSQTLTVDAHNRIAFWPGLAPASLVVLPSKLFANKYISLN